MGFRYSSRIPSEISDRIPPGILTKKCAGIPSNIPSEIISRIFSVFFVKKSL